MVTARAGRARHRVLTFPVGLATIAGELNAAGHRTQRGNDWTANGVKLVLDRAAKMLYVANASSDAISVVNTDTDQVVAVVALGGGVFQNALLVAGAGRVLAGRGFTVLRPRLLPPNDGGIALGQIAVGAFRREG